MPFFPPSSTAPSTKSYDDGDAIPLRLSGRNPDGLNAGPRIYCHDGNTRFGAHVERYPQLGLYMSRQRCAGVARVSARARRLAARGGQPPPGSSVPEVSGWRWPGRPIPLGGGPSPRIASATRSKAARARAARAGRCLRTQAPRRVPRSRMQVSSDRRDRRCRQGRMGRPWHDDLVAEKRFDLGDCRSG